MADITFECTPSSLIAAVPCLACLSDNEMLAVLVGILATAADVDQTTLLTSSACYTCLSKKQMLQALVTIAGSDLLGPENTPDTILEQVKCLRQCSNEKQLLAALLSLLCNNIKLAVRT
jgi:hypothetical protein